MEENKKPIIIKVEAGTHYLCSCRQSKNFPYCDGSHIGSEFKPIVSTVTEPSTFAICGCGKSDSIYCNGSHK